MAQDAQASGRDVILASGSDQALVRRLADRFNLDGDHIGSTPDVNLTGAKPRAGPLWNATAKAGFAYVGDSACGPEGLGTGGSRDCGQPVEIHARRARQAMEQTRRDRCRRLDLEEPPEGAFARTSGSRTSSCSCHSLQLTGRTCLGFEVIIMSMIAFSFAASSIYIVNDLLDLDADRQHEKKRFRPVRGRNRADKASA